MGAIQLNGPQFSGTNLLHATLRRTYGVAARAMYGYHLHAGCDAKLQPRATAALLGRRRARRPSEDGVARARDAAAVRARRARARRGDGNCFYRASLRAAA